MTITSKYDGVCKRCGGKIRRGEQIEWTRDGGARHLECPAEPEAAAGGRPRERSGPPAESNRVRDVLFIVWRHGGNSNHRWRPVVTVGSMPEAIEEYNMALRRLRQGGIELRRYPSSILAGRDTITRKDGEAIKSQWSPRVRKHW